MNNNFEPEIIAYCCHYCAFAAADLAGTMRLEYPTSVKIIKLPCSGKVELIHLLKPFEDGADGVFVAGCLEGNCHYLRGNIRTKKRVNYVKSLLKEIGIEPERVEMFNMSSSMGPEFARVANEMTEKVRAMGPNPVKLKGEEVVK
ncbi:MAG: hydrogenase iron-sulfur subunit [Firmicutes bacterium]|nr:hydrogenase iron-sulfur subunit [Bacillota bacterium]